MLRKVVEWVLREKFVILIRIPLKESFLKEVEEAKHFLKVRFRFIKRKNIYSLINVFERGIDVIYVEYPLFVVYF